MNSTADYMSMNPHPNKNDPSPEELEDAYRIKRISGFLPDFKAMMDKKVEKVIVQICAKITKQELTPDAAFTACHEINAYRKALKEMETQTKIGPNFKKLGDIA